MNSKIFFIILLVLAVLVIFWLTAKQKQKLSTTTSVQTGSDAQALIIPSQTKSMGAVEIEVTPVSIVSGKNVIFKLSLNTHSVELDYDFTQIATLTDDQENSFKPIKWTGGNNEHHLEGELIFGPFSVSSKELTLTLNGVDSKVESFSWPL